MKIASSVIVVGLLCCTPFLVPGAYAQSPGGGAGGKAQDDATKTHGGTQGSGMQGGTHGGMMQGGGMMMSGEMMGMKAKQMGSMSHMMESMGEAMAAQAKSMKEGAQRSSMMRIARDARSAAATMKRMSAEMAKMEGMGTMSMSPAAAEMMHRSMASQKETMQHMQQEMQAPPAR
jgi:hypothetical protein